MITVKDIVKKYMRDNGHNGLYNKDADDCGCDGSAPCGDGPYENCCAAFLKRDGLYYPDRRSIQDADDDKNNRPRTISLEEFNEAMRR